MDSPETMIPFQTLGLALLLGLLVGLQRERSPRDLAGLRTFAIITVLGTMTAYLAGEYGGWILAAGFLCVVAIVAIGNLMDRARADTSRGMTTEFAVVLMYAVGAYLAEGDWSVAVAVGGGVAVLLQFKPELHRMAGKLGDEDLKAIMRFVLISFVILPVLPDEKFGPFEVWNPFEIWLMVVLIVGISLTGYIVYKFVGRRSGMLLGGLLGGVISSTATTVSYARRTALYPGSELTSVLVVVLAATVVYVRVLVEVSVVTPRFLALAAAPVGAMLGATIVPAVVLWFRVENQRNRMPEQGNPTELKSALFFGAMYSLVLLGLAASQHYGGQGLYGVAWLSGVANMDAITLSTSRMVAREQIDPELGWKLIVSALLSNLGSKVLLAALLGGRSLCWLLALCFALPAAVGTVLLLVF